MPPPAGYAVLFHGKVQADSIMHSCGLDSPAIFIKNGSKTLSGGFPDCCT
ncbi:MAG: hypothetical protein LBU32_31955 [Clostridiales bacterium]|nr:hypothetical protein [Clostridiales bacterium]